jgi:hypothetical protein
MFTVADKPGPTRIPWFLADMAYSKYSAQHGKSQTLERMKERGGFWASEMDEFVPDWRERAERLSTQSATLACGRPAKPYEVRVCRTPHACSFGRCDCPEASVGPRGER